MMAEYHHVLLVYWNQDGDLQTSFRLLLALDATARQQFQTTRYVVLHAGVVAKPSERQMKHLLNPDTCHRQTETCLITRGERDKSRNVRSHTHTNLIAIHSMTIRRHLSSSSSTLITLRTESRETRCYSTGLSVTRHSLIVRTLRTTSGRRTTAWNRKVGKW